MMENFEKYYHECNRNSVEAIVFDPRYGSGRITGIGDSNVHRNICVRFESRPRTSMDSGSKWYTLAGRDSEKDKSPILQKGQPPMRYIIIGDYDPTKFQVDKVTKTVIFSFPGYKIEMSWLTAHQIRAQIGALDPLPEPAG